jgi:hypothetical protein
VARDRADRVRRVRIAGPGGVSSQPVTSASTTVTRVMAGSPRASGCCTSR